jgi:thiamine biosynthesis lipoprotein
MALGGSRVQALRDEGAGWGDFFDRLSEGKRGDDWGTSMVLAANDSLQAVQQRVARSAYAVFERGLYQLSFRAMSTICRVSFEASNAAQAREFQQEVLSWVGGFEARYSRFIPDNLLGRINAAAGREWVEVDPETEALLTLCQEMVFFTRGVFDPTALPLLRLWNWKARPPVIPDSEAIKDALKLVGWGKIQRRPGMIFLPRAGMGIDLGGIGKEYAVDRVLAFAKERGLENALVDFGQDVRAQGRPPGKEAWHIGLQDPGNLSRCWTGVAVTDRAVATSGDAVRHFEHAGRRYGHILDPRTGYPVNNGTLSVSVIAPHCTFAGILSTAAFVLGLKEGLELIGLCPGVEGCIITENARNQTRMFHAYRTS